ncbi:protein srg1 [Quercus suber]|uniref:Protein srg1 n=1 Tax=Quercus suber TaxID=58331 RepID=A0AAW0KGA7_QUESU
MEQVSFDDMQMKTTSINKNQELVKLENIKCKSSYSSTLQDSRGALSQFLVFISDTTSLSQVPVIDMQRLFSAEFMDTELEKLHYASKEWGFFLLINHGVSISLVEKVKVGIQKLFNLPMEEKKKIWQLPGDIEGFGQAFVVSEEQKLDWGDMFYMVTRPINLRKPHLFPKIPLPFKDNLDAYSAELQDLAIKILELMAKALRMEHNDMRSLF